MDSSLLFYRRYITDLDAEASLKGEFPLVGESPFGNGPIEIKRNGHFDCKATNQIGKPERFLQLLYPHLTYDGKKRALETESVEEDALDYKRQQSQWKQFLDSEARLKEFEYLTGVPSSNIKDTPLWLDQTGKILHYLYRNDSNQPLCHFSWRLGKRNETLTGVPRIEEPTEDADRIWFVENPLIAVMLEEVTGEPAYVRPNVESLRWNTYSLLAKDKTVVLLMGNDRGDWEYSFYPLLRRLYNSEITVKAINAPALTRGSSPLLRWLQKDSAKDELLGELAITKPNQLSAFNRDTYHSNIQRSGIKQLYFPQDVHLDRYWYGLEDGKVALSSPINVLDPAKIEDRFELKTEKKEDATFRLTRTEVINIRIARNQLSPRRTFENLRDLILDYFYLHHNEMASLIALWIMGSYVYRLFPAYGYLYFNGEAKTGKTSLLELIALCGFNGLLQSQATKAVTVQRVDKLGCVLCLDENEASSTGTGDEFVQMINSGYKKSGNISKMHGNKELSLNSYSPKAFGSIDDIGVNALKSRTIFMKTTHKPSSSEKPEWDQDKKSIQRRALQIRRGGYVLGLYHHETIDRYYRRINPVLSLPSGKKLDSRQREMLKPLLAIARLVDTNGQAIAEPVLMKAFEQSLAPEASEQATRENLLAKQLEDWNNDPNFNNEEDYCLRDKEVCIFNEHWENTELKKHVGSKRSLFKWFRKSFGIKKSQTIRMKNREDSKSCTLFPVDVIINGKLFTDWFTLE